MAKLTTPYGSILRTANGAHWYTGGTWRLMNHPSCLPSILAYAPVGDQFPLRPNQKTLDLNGVTLVKVSNQPLDVYSSVYLPPVRDLITGPRFGRLVFLDEQHVVEVRDPRQFARQFISRLQPEGAIVADLCRRLGVNPETDIGIWGSCLMFDEPVRRHEIDILIYGQDLSYRAYERMLTAMLGREFQMDPQLGICSAFCYKGTTIDLFFAMESQLVHPLHKARIRVLGKLFAEEITIEDTGEALFYPALYTTSTGKRLLSFRPAHSRRFFRQGSKLRFESISVGEIDWSSGSKEEFYGILDYETGQFVK